MTQEDTPIPPSVPRDVITSSLVENVDDTKRNSGMVDEAGTSGTAAISRTLDDQNDGIGSAPRYGSSPFQTQIDIARLQEKIAALTSRIENLEPNRKDNSPKFLDLEIKRLPISKWEPLRGFHRDDINSNVLVLYYERMPSYLKTLNDISASTLAGEESTDEGRKTSLEIPKRVQINSRPLLNALEKITGNSMQMTPMIMLPPFKIFLLKRDEIAKTLKSKKEAWERLKEPGNRDDTFGPATKEQGDKNAGMEQEKILLDHLGVLLDFIDTDLKDLFDFRERVRRRDLQTISFDNLWHLFNPGDWVFKPAKKGSSEDPEVYRVYCVTGGRPIIYNGLNNLNNARRDDLYEKDPTISYNNSLKLCVDVYHIDFDGRYYGPQHTYIQVKPFYEEILITDLEIYPMEFNKDHENILSRLTNRGKRFKEIYRVPHKTYDGLTLGDPEEVQGEVVIDFKTGYDCGEVDKKLNLGDLECTNPGVRDTAEWARYGDEGRGFANVITYNFADRAFDWKRAEEFKAKQAKQLELIDPEKKDIPEDYLHLLPRGVLAYVFRSRSWHFLDVDIVRDIDSSTAQRQSGFDELIITPEHKDLLLALVKNHASGVRSEDDRDKTTSSMEPTAATDLIPGKGKGLIVLLHGAPGVGKTLTAETIAAYTGRPLYPITCGDIGQTPREIETNLEQHFKLAHKWGCVLLLDEADVFLAKRERGDVKRNGLVSVFLRTLEYYSGILFLTTNRVGAFDEAFKSRIHISLHYPTLDLKRTEDLWKNHLDRIEKQNATRRIPISFDRKKLLQFAVKHFEKNEEGGTTWNGRQIRNAFQTAIALAEYDRADKLREKNISEAEAATLKKYQKMKLTRDEFKKVGKASAHFDIYMREVRHGKVDADIAHAENMRDDMWNAGMDKQKPRFKSKSVPSAYGSAKKSTMHYARSETPFGSRSKRGRKTQDDSDEESTRSSAQKKKERSLSPERSDSSPEESDDS